jgi:arylsulfatase
VVHWPAGISARGELRTNAVGHVIDLAPTMLSLAGGDWPPPAPAPSSPGRDLTPTFQIDRSLDRQALWWYHEGHRAIRVADWKLVAARDDPWELYDLASDRAENHNLAVEQAKKVRELDRLWSGMAQQFRHDAAVER